MSDEPSSDPSSEEPSETIFPLVAVVILVVIVVFVGVVIALLLIRKCLLTRGVIGPQCSLDCCPRCSPQCSESCKGLAEKLDCRTPDCRAWLDNICPSKEQCSLACGQVWSCYCCYMMADACKDVNICPDCQAIQCPDCDCGDCCHCALKAPECSQITCLCFECGRPPEE